MQVKLLLFAAIRLTSQNSIFHGLNSNLNYQIGSLCRFKLIYLNRATNALLSVYFGCLNRNGINPYLLRNSTYRFLLGTCSSGYLLATWISSPLFNFFDNLLCITLNAILLAYFANTSHVCCLKNRGIIQFDFSFRSISQRNRHWPHFLFKTNSVYIPRFLISYSACSFTPFEE